MSSRLYQSEYTTSTNGPQDFVIPAFATHVYIDLHVIVLSTLEHTISFTDSGNSLVRLIGEVDSIGSYRFFVSIPSAAVNVRINLEFGGGASSTPFLMRVNFIVSI